MRWADRWASSRIIALSAVVATGVGLGNRSATFRGYEDFPAPRAEAATFLVTAEAYEDRAMRLNWGAQQLLLTDVGWDYEFMPADAASDGIATGDVGLVASTSGQPPESSGWRSVGTVGDVDFWVRVE